MESLAEVRQKFQDVCISNITQWGAHSVTFQPKQSRINEDRVAIEQWQIRGLKWSFLAVFDGHGGTDLAEYAAQLLATQIQAALTVLLEAPGFCPEKAVESISDMLSQQINRFDRDIGQAVRNLCDNPDELDATAAQTIVDANFEVLARAHYGSTLAAALIDENGTKIWVASVGDSTAGISYLLPDGTRDAFATRLPKATISLPMTECSAEQGHFPLALGDYSLKLPKAFSEKLFFKLPNTFSPDYAERVKKFNKTPPYLTASPTVEYFDLSSNDPQAREPILILFSDGVDNIVKGEWVFHQDSPRSDEPSTLVGALLGAKVSEYVESVLGHSVESGWLGAGGNIATEVLGNLLAGIEVKKFVDAMDPLLLGDVDKIYIDDVTLIVFPLRSPPPAPV
ncbi:protein serine/threonine phosphatase 2C [Mycena latifolia]|nr:protein serine/threonine phosphatase 2C [Mycena latifolia]